MRSGAAASAFGASLVSAAKVSDDSDTAAVFGFAAEFGLGTVAWVCFMGSAGFAVFSAASAGFAASEFVSPNLETSSPGRIPLLGVGMGVAATGFETIGLACGIQ